MSDFHPHAGSYALALDWRCTAIQSAFGDEIISQKHERQFAKDWIEFQRQSYDHVLKEDELEQEAIETTAEYIARNPERKGLVAADAFASYSYTGCLLTGAPLLRLFTEKGWDEVWQTLAFLKRTECYRKHDSKYQ